MGVGEELALGVGQVRKEEGKELPAWMSIFLCLFSTFVRKGKNALTHIFLLLSAQYVISR